MADPERLLALYRDASGPTRAAEQRMLAALHVQLGRAAAGGSAAATSGTALAGKLVAVLIAASSVVALVHGLGASEHEFTEVDTHERAPLVDPTPALDPVPAAILASTPPPELERVPAEAPSLTPARVDERARPRTRKRAHPQAATMVVDEGPVADAGMAAEAKLLREADAALRRGALDDARQLLDEHRLGFRQPNLADEAELLARLLDCHEGRPNADALARRYLDAHPQSPAAARVAATCTLE